MNQLLAQIQDLQDKVSSLSDAREFHDPETASSAGATHVRSQTPKFLSPRTMPRCDSGLPRNTQSCMGTSGHVFERPLAQEGRSSTVFNNSKNLASSSCGLKQSDTGKIMKQSGLRVESPSGLNGHRACKKILKRKV